MKFVTQLKSFNKLYKEMDTVYHNYAKSYGLSDMAYWILYSIAESDDYFTQSDFCNDWFFAPQTANSALKDLEKKDIIYLEQVSGNKKNKLIKPTENGKKIIETVIAPLINAENESFESMSSEESEQLLSTTQKYLSLLKNKLNNIEPN